MMPEIFYSDTRTKIAHEPNYRTLWGYVNHEIKWFNVFFLFFVHLYAFKVYFSIRPEHFPMVCWAIFFGSIGGFGVTGGAHRYFTHKCYKATFPLRVLLMLAYTSAGQNTLFDWVRDHRVHHKYSETDADPHNSRRGFFFAHCGWLMMKKHPDVIIKGKTVDCSDVLADPVVRFHQKYFWPLRIFLCFVLPTIIPMYFWGWDLQTSFDSSFGKWVTLLHCTWSVNSVAHMWGTKPYNKDIHPAETKVVSFLSMGEGWHNYHHTFPWDYKASEFSYHFNMTTFWIDVFAKLGWAYDLKQPSKELVKKTIEKFGDGSHFEWGQDVK
ncbi:acyl-CoA Delta-9 desaturase-like [Coccinella septempunctata]|uniref:acyl-CoA Delta-9 desaturase-like n=1 Tax=Coccinella septempunctata TaxID=41139 RepID=UPI001D05DDD7|nr:acyl-CoA Delta-9 desaturase-like [Coccinella septempunctata]